MNNFYPALRRVNSKSALDGGGKSACAQAEYHCDGDVV